ncbi:MAG: DUF2142 domain-containing protein [Verrucomicrobiae bacterium]|nr:DUF2142 domain-containing protein [Verrucomicrobiae bacterium]
MNKVTQPANGSLGKIIIFLGLLAMVHSFIFTAAFPCFSVVDEQQHLDLVLHYARADVPRTLTLLDSNTVPFLVIYDSPEYMQASGPIAPPPWQQPIASVRARLTDKMLAYQTLFQNHEASQPPLYYSLAGAWWQLGKQLNLDGLALLYWLRFLGVPLSFALVWLGWVAARNLFPENDFIQVAVPALIAFLPQTTFYTVNNDNLSPLVFGAAFLLLMKFWGTEMPGRRLAAATGLALAATYLTKLSNLPLLAVAGLFVGLKILGWWWRGRLRASLWPLALLLLCAAGPMAAWMIWCQTNFGDLTGTAQKIKFLNWSHKPFSEWLHHPLFTAQGFWFFLKTNLATFWQGEQLWHRRPLANPAVDSAYAALTLGALALTLAALLRPRSGFTTQQRAAVTFGFLCFVAMLAFFALLSVKYDFQDCFYPSRAQPYFTSGRLMLGMLVPFLILFAAGLDRLMKNFQATTRFFMLVMLLAFMLASELATDLPVFASDYNWFHR